MVDTVPKITLPQGVTNRTLGPKKRIEIIRALQRRFPVNHPGSWARHSNKQLLQWAYEHLAVEEVSDD